jgi:hypothetical protein
VALVSTANVKASAPSPDTNMENGSAAVVLCKNRKRKGVTMVAPAGVLLGSTAADEKAADGVCDADAGAGDESGGKAVGAVEPAGGSAAPAGEGTGDEVEPPLPGCSALAAGAALPLADAEEPQLGALRMEEPEAVGGRADVVPL